MTCETAKILILFSRQTGPGDLTREDATALANHLNGCAACSAQSAKHRAEENALAQAFQAVPTPVGLSDKLLKEAYARQGAAWRRKIYLSVAAVALVAMGGLTGAILHRLTRPQLDTNSVLDQLQTDFEDPEAATLAWLKAQKLPQHLPEAFDCRLLANRGRSDLQGQAVPCLTFQVWRPGEVRAETAKVFIISANQFQLHRLQEGQNSFGTVRIIPDDGRGWAYVIVHTGHIEFFLKPNAKQVTRL